MDFYSGPYGFHISRLLPVPGCSGISARTAALVFSDAAVWGCPDTGPGSAETGFASAAAVSPVSPTLLAMGGEDTRCVNSSARLRCPDYQRVVVNSKTDMLCFFKDIPINFCQHRFIKHNLCTAALILPYF